jgi:hypothetical protein
MPTIAISYRREDTRWIVGRIFDHLVGHYGHDNIFMDIDGVPLGLDFRALDIERAVVVGVGVGLPLVVAEEGTVICVVVGHESVPCLLLSAV